MIHPVKKEIVVETSQARAFDVFTGGIDRWWLREHHIGKSPLKRAVLEPRVGGRWFSICEDDSECDIGKVLVWDPPSRIVLSWQINASWQFDETFVTELEVNFFAESASLTRVELEHRNLERYGDAAEKLRQEIDSAGGWGKLLESFGKSAMGAP